jgi:hypothetical protein
MIEEKHTASDVEPLTGTIEPESVSGNNVGGNALYNPEEWTGPAKKCPKTGRFLPGTGVSRKGGRKHGSRDKITVTMVDMANHTLQEHGAAMWEELSRTDPVACLALISKLLPTADLSAAIQGENSADNQQLGDISIRLVSDNTNALTHEDAKTGD